MFDVKSNLFGILAIVGGLLMIVGVFMDWVVFDLGFLGTETVSGMEVLDELESDEVSMYAPMIALVIGVVSLLVGGVSLLGKADDMKRIMSIATIILAIVVVIFAFMFNGELSGDDFGIVEAGTGLWIALVGGIVSAVGGVLGIVKLN
ncbi:MAG: hypothetical protein IKD00_03575 [Candidatus Methanomethylophilaceae archaeon]|nr:hypothetical protein [Candidatus Methanomethylophilaceae archaeon]